MVDRRIARQGDLQVGVATIVDQFQADARLLHLPGLTHQGPLDDFWRAPGTVDRQLFERFRWWLRTKTQLNGSVWSDIYEL